MPEPFIIHEDDCELERWDDASRGNARWRMLVSSDRSPTDSLSVGVAELEPGGSEGTRAHRHAPPEVYYILSGEGTVRIAGTDHPVRAGSAVFVPGGAEHCLRNTGKDPLRLLFVFPEESFRSIHYEFSE